MRPKEKSTSSRFTVHDTAVLLIDHQVGTMKMAASTDRDDLVRNMRTVARAAVALGPTTSQEDRFRGPLIPDLLDIAPGAHALRVRRPGVVDAGGSPAARPTSSRSGG